MTFFSSYCLDVVEGKVIYTALSFLQQRQGKNMTNLGKNLTAGSLQSEIGTIKVMFSFALYVA